MGLQTIESQDMTLERLFDDFYIVPSYQREYVWEEKHVLQLLEDVYDEFSFRQSVHSEYFIGSIVVCGQADRVFELIDGQQRITTIYLTLCAIRDHLRAIPSAKEIEALSTQIAATQVDEEGRDVFRYRLTLQYEDSADLLEKMAHGNWNPGSVTPTTRSVRNLINAYQTIRGFLRERFGEDVAEVRRYYAYLTKNVKLIRVRTTSVAHALRVFETINDRGVGLDAMDLLKNLLFMRVRSADFEKLKTRWKTLIDGLYRAGEKPLRFLRYFIFARYGADELREDEIYEWFVNNEEKVGISTKPLAFVDELLSAVQAYTNFAAGNDVAGRPNRYLTNIRHLSGTARQHLILLLAGRHLPEDCFSELCRHLENLLFAYIITREPTRQFERQFAQWAGEVREIQDRAGLSTFVDRRIRPAKDALAARFQLAMSNLREGAIQRYRLRYILAKLTQYVDEQAYGSTGASANLDTYLDGRVDIEHVLPQTPSDMVFAHFDRPNDVQDYVHRLGNLLLLEKSINASVGNGTFHEKKRNYRQSKFLLTKSIADEVTVGTNTAINRAVQGLASFSTWTSRDIERRHELLVRLAQKVWDMPAPVGH